LWTSIVLRIGDLSSSSLVHMAQSSPLLSYLESHGVQEKLTLAIKSVLKNRPAEPLKAIGHALVQSASAPAASLAICSWNMAAINNNPFEYWLTHTDPEYATLMEKVEDFMQSPGDKDVPVEAIFTQEMFDKLDTHMTKQGWEGQAECAQYWSELRSKTIISGFLKDKALGDKRLMSMPDRMTNTIDVKEGECAYRPTPISSYEGDMPNVAKWWPLWCHFLFEQKLTIPGKKGAASSEKLPCELLGKIPRSKYPALTEEEENMSVRLQAVCLAVFDCILVHMLHTLSNDGKWLDLKKKILESLTHAKEPKQINILKNAYAGTDVIFLQEVRTSTMRTALPAAFGDKYTVHFPNSPSKADQNSIVLLAKSRFEAGSVKDLTVQAMEEAKKTPSKASISDGDLYVISAVEAGTGKTLMFASFHGDTDGLATAPALAAVHAVATTLAPAALIFGLDANTYSKPKPGKQAGVDDFIADYKDKGYASNFKDLPVADCLTTSNARTFLQPQLQKACKAADKAMGGDFNPKDHLLFTATAFELESAGKDNTGKKEYKEGMVVPTLDWPSDHGLIYCTLRPKA